MQFNRSILVVEDDETTRELIEDFLSGEGYRVFGAPDGRMGLRLAEELSPGLILLDMLMPLMDGRAFCEEYRQSSGPHAPIVVLTAAFEAQMSAQHLNAQGYLSKPFNLDDLLETIRRHLA